MQTLIAELKQQISQKTG